MNLTMPDYVDDVCQTVAAMEARGAIEVMPAEQTPWGDLRARVRDPFGYLWDIAQRNDRSEAEL